jgi:hypothetical protein
MLHDIFENIESYTALLQQLGDNGLITSFKPAEESDTKESSISQHVAENYDQLCSLKLVFLKEFTSPVHIISLTEWNH